MEKYNRTWRALHIFLHDHEQQEKFLLQVIKPIITSFESKIEGWFYIRYWEEGPHLRLRVLGINNDDFKLLQKTISHAAVNFLQSKTNQTANVQVGNYLFSTPTEQWVADGSVIEYDYNPEFNRYGGYHAMQYSEDMFCHSSVLSLQLLQLTSGSLDQRLMIALDLLLVGAYMLHPDRSELKQFFTRHSQFWQNTLNKSSPDDSVINKLIKVTQPRITRLYEGLQNQSCMQVNKVWMQIIRRLIDKLIQLGDTDLLLVVTPIAFSDKEALPTGEKPFAFILNSQLHMMTNRLGISPFHECALSSCITRAL